MTAHKIEIKILKESISEEDFEILFSNIGELLEQKLSVDDYFMRAAFAEEEAWLFSKNN